MAFQKQIISSALAVSLLFSLPAVAQFDDFPPPPPVEDFSNAPPPQSAAPTPPTVTPSNGPAAAFPPGRPAAARGTPARPASGERVIGPTAKNKSGVLTPGQKSKFSKAGPEDINSENFPETIESFDFPNVEITDIIKAISELTGKNFIIDSTVRGKITIIAPSKITVAEAYKAFLSALAINGFTIVPSGGFLKIRNARSAQRDNIDTYSGSYYPNSDQMITKIIHLKHISADTVQQQLRLLTSSYGEMSPYTQTNSLIISDFGANIDRVMKILNQLDVPGFEDQIEVIGIRYTKAKDIAELIDKVVNKGEKKQSTAGGFSSGVPRFTPQNSRGGSGGQQGANYFLVFPDDRTNSLIVVGNRAGINRVKKLISQLDFKFKGTEQGGVYVYYVKYGEAEKIAQTLQEVAKDAGPKQGASASGGGLGLGMVQGQAAIREGLFGGDVSIKADKNTNALVISASKEDYEKVLSILGKLDIARDQVYVEGIIMEMSLLDGSSSSGGLVQFNKEGGKSGFVANNNDLVDILSPLAGAGNAILAFSQGPIEVKNPLGATGTSPATVTVPSLLGFLKFIKSFGKTNILSTPQITATDAQEAEIEVGDRVVTGSKTTGGGTAGAAIIEEPTFEDATIKMTIKPFISPSSENIRMEFKQNVKQLIQGKVPAKFADKAAALATRSIKTMVNVHNGDTAVIGGLIRDEQSELTKKVPLLGDLPILGWLFKGKEVSTNKINMVVFLTPRIIRNQEDQRVLLNSKAQERLKFIKQQGGKDPYGSTMDKVLKREARVPQNVQPVKR
ncbi:MAG: type II secretion system secretin GspD [Bdellovibrionaceae bacterium]|nr:type II secretion system secretin GspD [Bdellovibrio sp.]